MTAPFINYITGHFAGLITYKTFARWVKPEFIKDWNRNLRGSGITLGNDTMISFHRSRLPSGPRIYYFDHSRMEHIFVPCELQFDLDQETKLAEEAGF